MITLSERAALALDELLLKNEPPPGQGIKLVASGTQIGLTVAPPTQGDQILQRGDETLLIVEGDTPVAELKPIVPPVRVPRPFGLCTGEFTTPDDFDAPLPESVIVSCGVRKSLRCGH